MLPDLAHWAIRIGRDLIEKHCNSADFGALVAYAAVLAWRDRGPGWWLDGERTDASTPPGGWAGTVGTTQPTWRAWRGRAIEIGLISEHHGRYESGASVPTMRPAKPYRTREHEDRPGCEVPDEQFARIPCSVLFDPKIGRTAKRTMVGLALYRNKEGFARAGVKTIARVASLNERNARHGLRQLERAGVIRSNGLDRRVRTYEVIHNLEVIHTEGESQRPQLVKARDPKGGKPETPGVKVSDPPNESQRPQKVKVSDPPLSGEYFKKKLQEKTIKRISQAPNGSWP